MKIKINWKNRISFKNHWRCGSHHFIFLGYDFPWEQVDKGLKIYWFEITFLNFGIRWELKREIPEYIPKTETGINNEFPYIDQDAQNKRFEAYEKINLADLQRKLRAGGNSKDK